jgi:hypothetical protein
MRTLRTLFAAFIAGALSLASPAQNAPTGNSTAQAGLQINVIVVPAVAPPHDRHRDHDKGRDDVAVSYNLGSQRDTLSVTEEVRPMLVNDGNSVARQEQVRITTVVAR